MECSSYNEDDTMIAKSISYCRLVVSGKDDKAEVVASLMEARMEGSVEWSMANNCDKLLSVKHIL